MRYSSDHKAVTRERVVRTAAAAIRAKGPANVSVPELMAEAGLTHGAFYAHFASKDALLAEAIGEMFAQAGRHMTRGIGGLVAYLDFYLSHEHRDQPARGCPVAALGTELPRLNGPVRDALDIGVRTFVDGITAFLPDTPAREARATSIVAEMTGAVMLARGASDRALSDAILAASREAILTRASKGD